MRKLTRTALTAAAVAVIAAGGSAFAASNTMPPDKVAGYGSLSVSGAVIDSVHYNINPDGLTIDTVTLVIHDDTTLPGMHVYLGFDNLPTTECLGGVYVSPVTTYTCDNGGSNFTETTTALSSTQVVVG
jgi:hypothetical protein